eukprot:TRINITY_DN38977_c0_g1_i1.p1 TRINITY_DN38977_c0_g1~~TRINITY_DN38977_c0_g1_i1.p1  ORF type:complete len:446 (+),score=101.92 TRINITY_DN38977_c0_g1_i1:51-1340(+)
MEAPPWLTACFPGHPRWQTLRSCQLHVDSELGAGLDLEESEHGYLVEAVAEKPGQDPILQPGDTIIAINDERLMGGGPELDVGSVFGSHFRQDAKLLLLSSRELREALVEKESNEECPCEEMVDDSKEEPPEELANYELLKRKKSEIEHEATVRIPVGRATAWQLDPDTMADLQRDLSIVSENFGLSALPHCNEFGMQSVVLTGMPSAIAKARSEVVHILNFYREGRSNGSGGPSPMSPQGASAASGGYGGSTAEPTAALVIPDHVKVLQQFQYHDHTADIIVHAWGKTRAEAFSQVVVGMFNYMTPLENVELVRAVDVEAQGHDLLDLLYHLLDEFLYVFGTEMHISKCVEILSFDEDNFRIKARGYGEKMDLKKHEQGTEIKAITMHMMKILNADSVLSETGTAARVEAKLEVKEGFPHEAYVLLDI